MSDTTTPDARIRDLVNEIASCADVRDGGQLDAEALCWDLVAFMQEVAEAEVAALRAERERLRAALVAVEAHHAKLNDDVGRPQQNSYTLTTVRAALTGGANAER